MIDGSINNETGLSGGVLSRLNITPVSFQSQGWDKRRSENVPEVRVGVNELYLAYDFSFFLRMIPYMELGLIKRDMGELLKILKKPHRNTSSHFKI